MRRKLTTMNADENPTVTAFNLTGIVGAKTRLSGYYVLGNKHLDTDVYGFSGEDQDGNDKSDFYRANINIKF